jgi:hypothetical protein
LFQSGYIPVAPFSYGIPFMGGFCQWWYCKREDIETWPDVDPETQFLTAEPTLIENATWKGPILVPDDALGFEEPIARNAAGIYYKQKVMGFYPGDDAFSRINLGNMPYHEYIVIGKVRAGGFFVMLGTQERGLQFDADYASGNGGISTAGAKFAFSLNALEKGGVLLSFSEAPATAPPGYEVPDGGSGSSGGTGNDVEIITFNTETEVAVAWTDDRLSRFGIFPEIQVWKYIDGEPNLITVAITCDDAPPDQTFFTVFTPGTPGFIVLK